MLAQDGGVSLEVLSQRGDLFLQSRVRTLQKLQLLMEYVGSLSLLFPALPGGIPVRLSPFTFSVSAPSAFSPFNRIVGTVTFLTGE